MNPCQCDNAAHLSYVALTPQGKIGHKHRQQFCMTISVVTPTGTLWVCKECRRDCWHDIPEVQQQPQSASVEAVSLAAFEFGYRACERGLNLQAAIEYFHKTMKG